MSTQKRFQKTLPWIFPLLLGGIVMLQFFRNYGFFMEDGFILLRYAQNILNGNGWVFNPGEYYNAATSPLQVILYSLQGALLGVEHLEIIAYSNFSIWLFLFLFFFYRYFSKHQQSIAIIATLALAFIPHWYLTYGLETMMLCAFVMMALYAYQHKKFNILLVILSLLPLIRLEMLFVVMLFLVFLWKNKQLQNKSLMKKSLIVLIPTALWFMFSWMYFGKLLPETLASKIWQGNSGDWGTGYIFLKSALAYWIFYLLPYAKVLGVEYGPWTAYELPEITDVLIKYPFFAIILGVSILSVLKGLQEGLRNISGFKILFIWTLLHLSLYGILFNVPGYHWYMSFIAYLSIPALFIGASSLSQHKIITIIVVTALFIPFATLFTWDTHDTIEDKRMPVYRHLSQWIRSNTPEDAIIIHEEAGAIGYLSQRKMIDKVGLTTPQYLPLVKAGKRHTLWLEVLQPQDDAYLVAQGQVLPPVEANQFYDVQLVYEDEALNTRLYQLLPLNP